MRCPDCGGIVAMLEGCELCIHCGWSQCFSARPIFEGSDKFFFIGSRPGGP